MIDTKSLLNSIDEDSPIWNRVDVVKTLARVAIVERLDRIAAALEDKREPTPASMRVALHEALDMLETVGSFGVSSLHDVDHLNRIVDEGRKLLEETK